MAKSTRAFGGSKKASDKGKGTASHNVIAATTPKAELADLRVAGVSPWAIKMAAKIDAVETISTEFETAINATEYSKVSGLLMSVHIREAFTDADIDEAPIVDTNKTDDENYQGNNPDWTKVKEGKKTKRISAFNTMLGRSKYGHAIVASIEAMSDVLNKKEGHSKELRTQFPSEPTQKAELIRLRGRLSAIQNLWRKAWKIVQQENSLKELVGEHIDYCLTTDANGDLIHGPSPIYLSVNVPKGKAPIFDNFSVTSFLSLDFEAAVANRASNNYLDTWNAVLDTLSRDDGDDETDKDGVVITNENQFEAGMAAMLGFIEDHDEIVQKMVKRINGAKDLNEVKSLVRTIGDLANEMMAFKNHIQKRFERVVMLDSAEAGTLDAASTKEALASTG